MIQITDKISISEDEIKEDFIQASGPGGQNVNKVATAVQLRFDVKNSPSLPDDVLSRLIQISGKKISSEGILIINAKRFRDQIKNRKDATDRLIELIQKAAEPQKKRVRTNPSIASRKKRLEAKRRRSTIKKIRKNIPSIEEY